MGLKSFFYTLLGNVHIIPNLVVPPFFVLGEPPRRYSLAQDYRAASRLLQPGDLLVCCAKGYFFSNRAIRGTAFKHAALYCGPITGRRNPDTGRIERPKILPSGVGIHQTLYPRSVIHATSDGINCIDLLDLLLYEDYVAAFRPAAADKAKLELATQIMVTEACKLVGTPYDFGFDFSTHEKMCCTEFTDYLLKRVGLPTPPRILQRVKFFGPKVEVTLADSYALLFPCVWATMSCSEPAFVNQSAIPGVLRDRIYEAQDGEDLETRVIDGLSAGEK